MSDSTSSAARAAVDAAVSAHAAPVAGPARWHKLHGSIALDEHLAIRVTTQPTRRKPGGFRELPRLLIRPWYRRIGEDTWWPSTNAPGISITRDQAADFRRAVNAAVAHLLGEEPRS